MAKTYEVDVTVRTVYHVRIQVEDDEEIEEQACLAVCESNLNDYESMDVEMYEIFDESGNLVRIS